MSLSGAGDQDQVLFKMTMATEDGGEGLETYSRCESEEARRNHSDEMVKREKRQLLLKAAMEA